MLPVKYLPSNNSSYLCQSNFSEIIRLSQGWGESGLQYHVKGRKLYMYFVDLENAFNRVPRKVLGWAMRKKGIREVLFTSVMSLYERTKTRIRVDSVLSEEFEVKVGMHQGSVLWPFLFALVVDILSIFNNYLFLILTILKYLDTFRYLPISRYNLDK